MSDGEPNPSSNNGVSQAITLKASPHNATAIASIVEKVLQKT